MPVGTSLSQTDKVLKRVETILQNTPDVAGYLRRTGAELGFFATESFRGDILVSLKPPGERRKMEELFDVLREQLAREVPDLATVEFVPLVQDQINDLSGVKSPVEVKVFGPDLATLRDLAEQIGKILEQWEQEKKVADVNTNVLLGNPDIVIRPDSIQTARVGLSAQDVETQLNAALYGQVASTLPQQDRLMNIRVRYPDSVRYDIDRLARLPISLAAAAEYFRCVIGGSGRIIAVGQQFCNPGPTCHNTDCTQPQRTVARKSTTCNHGLGRVGRLGPGPSNRELQRELPKIKFPYGYRWELAGNYRSQQESFASLLTVLIVASAMVFLLLGFQFRSLTLPLLIFLTQPISLASAIFALWITGTPLNVSSFMGAILLIGLDVKNGIILIEYIGQLRKEGQTLNEALIHAGRRRFRPILMTSLCTIFGLVPLALGLGPGAQMQQPLAIAVIGGLFANMLLTRLLIPVG